jgi:hypothetical protein
MEIGKLSEVIKEDGVWFTPVKPDGSKCDFEFCVIGRNSAEYRKVLHKNAVALSSNKKGVVEETLKKSTIEMLTACVVGWKGLTRDGKEVPCTVEEKKRLFGQKNIFWLLEQIENFLSDDENFFLSVKE